MIAEIGHYALILALAVAIVQALVPLLGARLGDTRLMSIADSTALVQLVFIAMSFAALTQAYMRSDFSLLNVVENSHSAKPMLFKISGVWGNHEGSMLLWVLILALFGAAIALFGKGLPQRLRATTLSVQALVATAFYAFILFTSNPFTRVANPPIDGNDLNPVLQDVGLAIHPPLLYLGYVGMSVSFSFAIAALIEGRIDAAWARWVRPWTLAAWIFLTGGIAMGSYWAYYELGWGGWWFWDPVENASFMPWLAATALLHSAIVMEKREALKIWTIFLAILAFSFSLLGTFLVRSGVLTSVHAFASDPDRGVFILLILALFVGGSLALFAMRAGTLRKGGIFSPISREGALVFNNLFLSAASAAVLIGTLYPLLLETLTGEKISVGAPFFNLTFGPLMLPVLLAMPFGPLLPWKRGDLLAAAERLMAAGIAAALVIVAVLALMGLGKVAAAFGLALAAFLIIGAISEPLMRAGLGRKGGLRGLPGRLLRLPRATFGTMLAHAGLGVTLIGIVSVSAFEIEVIKVVNPGESVEVGSHQVTFEGLTPRQGPNYSEMVSTFTVRDSAGVIVSSMEGARRLYQVRSMPTTEAAIETFGIHQLYISPGEPTPEGGQVIRFYDKPLVTLIWYGCVLMMLGGGLSLADRRLRVGAPGRARKGVPTGEALA